MVVSLSRPMFRDLLAHTITHTHTHPHPAYTRTPPSTPPPPTLYIQCIHCYTAKFPPLYCQIHHSLRKHLLYKAINSLAQCMYCAINIELFIPFLIVFSKKSIRRLCYQDEFKKLAELDRDGKPVPKLTGVKMATNRSGPFPLQIET